MKKLVDKNTIDRAREELNEQSINMEDINDNNIVTIEVIPKIAQEQDNQDNKLIDKETQAKSQNSILSKGKKFNLPCSDKELNKIIKEIGIDGISDDTFQVKITNSICPALKGMIIDKPNFRELNFLAKELQKVPKKELANLDKIMEFSKLENKKITPKEAINLIYNRKNYDIYNLAGAKNDDERLEKLGNYLMKEKFKETPSAQIDKLTPQFQKKHGEKFLERFADTKRVKPGESYKFIGNILIHKKCEDSIFYKSINDISKLLDAMKMS
ncbi:MAG: hypothetical protein LBG48_04520 [Rickettsiales bacterium]|jgi:hypothetical protein|nr:hypothetical protein [Rickettsiales bacterium]MDR2830889.1 hypothetical protein [Candidatus Methanovirga basalitermitum]